MTARMLAIDFRRGPAPLLTILFLVLGGALISEAPGSCDGAMLSLRQAMWSVYPCVLAAAVWHGGAARRRRVLETVATSALPPWPRAAVEGGSIALAGLAAFAALAASLALTGCTGPISAEAAAAGGVTAVSLLAAGFAGLALGRVFFVPMAAPLTLFLVLAVTSVFGGWTEDGSWAMLVLPGVGEDVHEVPLRISLAQALWFAGAALSGWLLASQRGPVAFVPAVVGLGALAALA